MNSRILYKVTFLNAGKIYELYARRVSASSLWGFTEVADLVFDVSEGLVVDPTEERLRDELPSDLNGFAWGQCKSQQYLSPMTQRDFTIVSGGVTYASSVC